MLQPRRAYSGVFDSGSTQFWVLPFGGGAPRLLARGAFGSAVASPDGTWVATTFATVPDDIRSPHDTSLHSVDGSSTIDLGTADVIDWTSWGAR